MADIYELVLSLDLGTDLLPEDVAELRWHIGQGEAPEDALRLDRGYIAVIEDDDGDLICTDPQPFLSQDGPAWRIGGALGSRLEKTADRWHLEARQEVHPEDFEALEGLLIWLYRLTDAGKVAADGSVEIGRLRWYEDPDSHPLLIRKGCVLWP
ncbi:hypothetical protein LTV02_05225 [Nocardia yamanashiensis]|uniref:hypothetical protein n=1 Tax=Nocardia yamanashiensis TaxID=209247 RepID=UPI001E596CFB|nr:hypothetical protein [Nocardia yamanashiensis]UGT42807.1 hypothetical protein LTV02_05225 [Nocardia yamanashiensis]